MTTPLDLDFDTVIVGGGPAGLCAAMYAGRGMLKAVLLESKVPGGELLNTEKIEDYPGFESILGRELAQRMTDHARKFGAEIRQATVEGIFRQPDGTFEVRTLEGDTYRAPTVILTAGGTPTKLEVPGETGVRRIRRLLLRGVRWGVLPQPGHRRRGRWGRRGRGGGLPHPLRRQGLPGASSRSAARVQDPAGAAVRQSQDRSPVEQEGPRDPRSGTGGDAGGDRPSPGGHGAPARISTLPVSGCFVFIGFKPNTGLIREHFRHDASGYVITDDRMMTSIPGLFAAGDLRVQLVRQVTTAVGDATTAAIAVEKYLAERRSKVSV